MLSEGNRTVEIPLTQGKVAVIDAADYLLVSRYRWTALKIRRVWYAVKCIRVNGRQSVLYMHREILAAPRGVMVDHRNCDGLDNRRENLRLATPSQNMQNRAKNTNSPWNYKGIWEVRPGRWVAQIKLPGEKPRRLGMYDTEIEAAVAYDEVAREHHGEFAKLNIS